MQNIKKQTTISSLDFNNLRKLMDALINLKKLIIWILLMHITALNGKKMLMR